MATARQKWLLAYAETRAADGKRDAAAMSGQYRKLDQGLRGQDR